MNKNTGAIAIFETDEDARKAGHTVKLSEAEFDMLKPMNRKERRAWASKSRRARRTDRGKP